jgi:hypothetical protein
MANARRVAQRSEQADQLDLKSKPERDIEAQARN